MGKRVYWESKGDFSIPEGVTEHSQGRRSQRQWDMAETVRCNHKSLKLMKGRYTTTVECRKKKTSESIYHERKMPRV